MKVCSKCNNSLNESSFSPASGGKYLRSECKNCANILAKKRKELRKKYPYPKDDYKCPICLKIEQELKGNGGKAKTWVVDHDHITELFRSYLCHNCNRGSGIFNDNVERLKRLINYLNYHKNKILLKDEKLAKIEMIKQEIAMLNEELNCLISESLMYSA